MENTRVSEKIIFSAKNGTSWLCQVRFIDCKEQTLTQGSVSTQVLEFGEYCNQSCFRWIS